MNEKGVKERMTIRHLRIFQTVCRQGSITRAAQALYMTQPAVSHAISELEQEAAVNYLTGSPEKSI